MYVDDFDENIKEEIGEDEEMLREGLNKEYKPEEGDKKDELRKRPGTNVEKVVVKIWTIFYLSLVAICVIVNILNIPIGIYTESWWIGILISFLVPLFLLAVNWYQAWSTVPKGWYVIIEVLGEFYAVRTGELFFRFPWFKLMKVVDKGSLKDRMIELFSGQQTIEFKDGQVENMDVFLTVRTTKPDQHYYGMDDTDDQARILMESLTRKFMKRHVLDPENYDDPEEVVDFNTVTLNEIIKDETVNLEGDEKIAVKNYFDQRGGLLFINFSIDDIKLSEDIRKARNKIIEANKKKEEMEILANATGMQNLINIAYLKGSGLKANEAVQFLAFIEKYKTLSDNKSQINLLLQEGDFLSNLNLGAIFGFGASATSQKTESQKTDLTSPKTNSKSRK